jgi:probable phosphoglycerate mutase
VLYLIRHGRTTANAESRLQGRTDLPLDEVGHTQVAALLAAVPAPDVVICSPLQRARQTAAVFGVEPTIDHRWLELAYGEFEGVRLSEMDPEVWTAWMSDIDFAPTGGESIRDLGVRVFEACNELLDLARDSNVVVVSHATPIKVAMAWALGVDVSITWRSFIDQASISTVTVRGSRPLLTAFNIVPPR